VPVVVSGEDAGACCAFASGMGEARWPLSTTIDLAVSVFFAVSPPAALRPVM